MVTARDSSTLRPLIKVCGVTRVEDARACVDAGVDLLGLNFWPPSPRALTTEEARTIADAVRGRIELVGVFVDEPRGRVDEVDRAVGLDRLQFHGDEAPEFVAGFGDRALRAFAVDPAATDFDAARLDAYPGAWGYLFDVAGADAPGGTGRGWSYAAVAAVATERPTLVAGGVTPSTAAAALAASGRDGVDVCSGVESSPGVKDHGAIRRLVEGVLDG